MGWIIVAWWLTAAAYTSWVLHHTARRWRTERCSACRVMLLGTPAVMLVAGPVYMLAVAAGMPWWAGAPALLTLIAAGMASEARLRRWLHQVDVSPQHLGRPAGPPEEKRRHLRVVNGG